MNSKEISEELKQLVDRFDEGDSLEELEWEEVPSPQQELEQISVRLIKSDVSYLRQKAQELGLAYSELIRAAVRRYVLADKQSGNHSGTSGSEGNYHVSPAPGGGWDVASSKNNGTLSDEPGDLTPLR